MTESAPSIDPLLAAARAGSRQALGELLEACRHYLLHVANRELHADVQAKGGASDLVQETFLEAQRDFSQFDGETGPALLAWLTRLLTNNAADFATRYRTAKRQLDRESALPAGELLGSWGDAATPTPSAELMAREKGQALEQALARLPEDYRQVLVLRYQEERSFDDIARQMQRTAGAVRKLWLRAIQRLRSELKASS